MTPADVMAQGNTFCEWLLIGAAVLASASALIGWFNRDI